jgi:alpha-mannosidase
MPAPLLPFPQLLFQRLKKALRRLALEVYTDPVPLEVACTRPRRGDFSFEQALKSPLREVAVPSVWQAPGFSTSWFRLRPPQGHKLRAHEHVYWDDNAEATAWVGGEPLFGLDATHRRWPWPEGEKELWLESIFCQSGIWHAAAKGISPVGSMLTQAALVVKDEEKWQAYFDLEVLADWLEEEMRRVMPAEAEMLIGGFRTWPEMDSASAAFLPDGVGTGVANRYRPELDRLPGLLRRVFRDLDTSLTAYYRDGVGALRARLAELYSLLGEHADPVRMTLSGHAHIDLVWLWPESTGEQKAVRTFATADRLLGEYPEFYFGYSQPASYEAVARRSPGLFRRVEQRIQRGRWEAVGAMYVESDSLMACGEALLRSFTLGQKGFENLNGQPSKVLWLPDAFGFSGCLPALMRLTGVTAFFTNKLMWSMINRFPHSSFVWRGSDGSEVLAHVSRACGYNNPARPRNLRLELEAHRQSDVHPEMLLPAGWGDGGGGPTADIIERVRRQAALRNQPAAGWGRIDEFFARMEKYRPDLPVHVGEIPIEAHRGTYTTHGFMKLAYRRLEVALQTWEAVRCVAGGEAIPDHPWQRLVFAQFHDYLPGSSIHEVYEEMVPEHERLAKDARREAIREIGDANKGDRGYFNPLTLPGSVTFPSGRTAELPPLSFRSISQLRLSARKLAAPVAGKDRIESERVSARFDKAGHLSSLAVDGKESLCGPAQLICYRDVPYDLEAWEIDRQALDCGCALSPTGPRVPATGPGWAGLSQTWTTPGHSTVRLTWKLRAGSPILEADLEVDWREPEMLLRLEAPTPFRGTHALFGGPFGGSWRLQQPGDPRQSAQWEVPANRWILSADEGRTQGAFLLTEAKYGFSVRDGVLGVSLLKSAKVTLTTAFPPRFRAAGPSRPPFSDLGAFHIRLALGRFSQASSREELPAALADSTFAEPLSVQSPPRGDIMPRISGLTSVVPAWAAPQGPESWVLRLHETMGNCGVIRLEPAPGWNLRILKTAFGQPGKKLRPTDDIPVESFGIVSVEVFR